jgi:hypothetical protein
MLDLKLPQPPLPSFVNINTSSSLEAWHVYSSTLGEPVKNLSSIFAALMFSYDLIYPLQSLNDKKLLWHAKLVNFGLSISSRCPKPV